MGNEQFLKGD